MRDEKSQTVIGDLHGSRSVHFQTHKGLLLKNERSVKYCALKSGIGLHGTQNEAVFVFFTKSKT